MTDKTIDSLHPKNVPEALKNTKDVVMAVTDAFHSDYQGECVSARILRGFIDLNAMKQMIFLPSRLPCSVRGNLRM